MKARNLGPALSKGMSSDTDVIIEIDGKTYSPDSVENRGNLKVIIASKATVKVEPTTEPTPVIESSGQSADTGVVPGPASEEATDESDGTDEVEENEVKTDSADTDSPS